MKQREMVPDRTATIAEVATGLWQAAEQSKRLPDEPVFSQAEYLRACMKASARLLGYEANQ